MRFSDARRTTVMARDTAEEVGAVRRFVVDPASRRITALHVTGRKKKARLVDWEALTGFGPDAVVVGAADALRGPADGRERAVVSGNLDLDGRLVLSDRGDQLGTVTDIEFDESTGELRTIVMGDAELPADRLRQVGRFCLLVRAP